MPRTPKREDSEVELTDEQRAAVEEELLVEEATAAFFAAEKSEEAGDAEEAEVDEGEAESLLSGSAGDSDGETSDSVRAEAEEDAGSAGEEPARTEESAEAKEETASVEAAPVHDIRTAAEKRPTTAGGLTVITS